MLEVLERDGELAKVQDQQGESGWIDAAYLMTNPPARQMLERLERANKELQTQLDTAKNNPASAAAATENPDSNTAVDQLTKENTELKRKLSTEKITNAKLTEQLNTVEAQLGDRPLSAAETQVTALEKTITELKRDLENSVQENKALKAQSRQSLTASIPKLDISGFSWPLLVGGIVLLIVAYGGGITPWIT